jgi:RimJ/RimL family protein N-acetyltransferase
MARGWEGEKVRLVPLDKGAHFENALAWLNDPEATAWTLVGDTPMTRLGEQEFFDNAMRPGGDNIHFAIETLEGEHIGFCGFIELDWRHGVARTGTIIGASQFRGRGFGTDAIRTRTRYAFEVLGLRILLTEAMQENTASIRALKKVGYREIGVVPERFWKRGAYRDLLLLALDRRAWDEHNRKAPVA